MAGYSASNLQDLRPFEYDLPHAPKSVVDSWVTRLQAVAIVTALLTQIEASFVGSLPTPAKYPSPLDSGHRLLGYAGMILNLSATLSSVMLLLAVTQVPTSARKMYIMCPHGFPRKMFHSHNNNDEKQTLPFHSRSSTGDYASTSASSFGINLASAWNPSNRDTTREDVGQSLDQIFTRGDSEGNLLYAFGIAKGWGFLLRHCMFCFLGGCLCTFVHIGIGVWIMESTAVAAILMPFVLLGFIPPLVIFGFRRGTVRCRKCVE